MKPSNYNIELEWTGNHGSGTFDYRSYKRTHNISNSEKSAVIHGSADPNYLGDTEHYNPEELLIASLSGCFMLWYLSLCAKSDVVVTQYTDSATGILSSKEGINKITIVALNPQIVITSNSDQNKAMELITTAHDLCYIANSVNFEVTHKPTITIEQ